MGGNLQQQVRPTGSAGLQARHAHHQPQDRGSSPTHPRIIRLGSLRDICRELGRQPGTSYARYQKCISTKTPAPVSLRRSGIGRATARSKRWRRVSPAISVVFTGEKLPDGRKADAVYIVLSDIYMQVINGAMTRPLDYDYLKGLPPASQRFYELLSYRMYAAIKNDRPRAKLTVFRILHLCSTDPAIRLGTWSAADEQDSSPRTGNPATSPGSTIEQTVDGDGRPDWVMLYVPGPKARAEYRAFARRGGPAVLEVEPFAGGPLAPARRPRAVAAGGGADRARHHPGHGRRPGAGPRRGEDPGPDRAARLAGRDEAGQGRRPGGLAGRGHPERPRRPQGLRLEGRASTARGGAAGPGT